MATEHILLGGAGGNMEVFIDHPEGTPTGIAVIGHPHPLKGGTADNKVVYPEAVWYTYVDKEDIDEIIDSHLRQGKVVERLKV